MNNINANPTKSQKKKKIRNSDWINVAKWLRNSNTEYVNRNNNIVPAKEFENKDMDARKNV